MECVEMNETSNPRRFDAEDVPQAGAADPAEENWDNFMDDWDPMSDPPPDEENAPAADENERVVAMLCYATLIFLPFVFPIIVLLSRKRTHFQTFHAAQSLGLGAVLGGFWILMVMGAVGFGFSIPVLGVIVAIGFMCLLPLTWVMAVIMTLYCAYRSFQGLYVQIPVLYSFMQAQGWMPKP